MLRVTRHELQQARDVVVDVHTHFGYRLRGSAEQLEDFVQIMDRNRIAVCVSLDGTLPDGFEEQRNYLWSRHRDRFVIFANLDWQGSGQAGRPETWACSQPEFVRRAVEQLEVAAQRGASGLKLFKQFGLAYRNADGSLLRIDDRRWDPIWEACGRLQLPVLMHTGDPAAFFLPVDASNERYEELQRHPDWSFYGPQFPSRTELLAARNRVIERHPGTKFIGAHVANNSEDLAEVGRWLNAYPNLSVELASRISELGRQPYTARKFLLDYADRVMFGTDGPWPEPRLRLYWRFLETYDEYFPYSEKDFPPQGFWNIYGVGLPDDVLAKIYHQNAARLIPGVADRLAKWQANRVP
jgi:predicted TIM-barrel fold metal-dependent hydrolase